MKRPLLSFIIAVALCYGSDLAPYYVAAFSGGALKVLGPLTRFSTECFEENSAGKKCGAAYRIPRSLVSSENQFDYVGVGIVVQPIRVLCEGSGQERRILEGQDDPARTAMLLRTYQTFKVDRQVCSGDLVIENWISPELYRHGYSQGPVTVGDRNWVTKTKVLVEFFQTGVATICTFLLLFYAVSLSLLRRSTQIRLNLTVFDDFILHCLVVLSLGFLLDSLVPISSSSFLSVRLSNWCGFVLVSGSVLRLICQENKISERWRHIAKFCISSFRRVPGLSPLGVFGIGMILSPFFAAIYPASILTFSLIGVLVGLITRNSLLLMFGSAATSDSFKMFMVPYFPASRMTFVCITVIVIYELFQYLWVLSDSVRADTIMRISAQLAHDIRSPVATLTNLLPRLEGDPEIKEVVGTALYRIKGIATNVLDEFKQRNRLDSESLFDVSELTAEVLIEKSFEMANSRGRTIRRLGLVGPIYAFVAPEIFKRILSNLIDNAIEATVENGGELSVKISNKKGQVSIEITDTGVGFSDGVLRALDTQTFVTSTKQGGNGLGLIHAKRTLESWGGDFSIQSIQGVGSSVRILLKSSGHL